MIAEPGLYLNAVNLMQALRVNNIDCGEIPGAIRINPIDEYQANDAADICAELGIYWHDGNQSFALDFRDAMREEND